MAAPNVPDSFTKFLYVTFVNERKTVKPTGTNQKSIIINNNGAKNIQGSIFLGKFFKLGKSAKHLLHRE